MTQNLQQNDSQITESLKDTYNNFIYDSNAFPLTHPRRIGAVSHIYGISPEKLEKARVLEIGCAAGGNIIPIAVQYPNSQCVGVDLSENQIAQGQKIVDGLNLTNMKLLAMDITKFPEDMGQFDYIVCHGVFSWVPESVREGILQVCNKHLAEHGVAMISYNVYPGWHFRGALRQMMLQHTENLATTEEKVAQCRALLNALAAGTGENTPYGQYVRAEAKQLANSGDYYIAHEHLELVNHPFYLKDFMELAEKNGLNYLCDAEFFSSKAHWYSQQAQQALAPFLNDRFKLEAYIDMFSNRTFRHSLLVKDTNKVTAATVENLKQFATINFAGTYQQTTTNGTLTEVKAESFKSATGNSINASFPITKSAFQVLSKIYPATLNFDELYVQAEKLLVEEYKYKADTQDKERLLNDLAAVFNWNAIELHYVSVGIATSVPQKPKASDYTRWEAENGKNRITNLRHESLVINDATRLLIFLCDGTRTIDDLTNEMVRRTSNGLIQLPDAFAAPKNANNKAHLEACQKYIAAALPELVLKAIWIQE